jgi:hypothetical protein
MGAGLLEFTAHRTQSNNINANDANKFLKLIKSSQTHQSFISLIDKDADLILTARKMSPDEKTHADAAAVSLIEPPILERGADFLDAYTGLLVPFFLLLYFICCLIIYTAIQFYLYHLYNCMAI